MQNGSEQQASEEAPLYVRWNPDRSPYAIELRLDLVAAMAKELDRADKLSMEIGAVLVGTLPTASSPTLRIEEVAIVPRGLEEGTTYVLNPGQHDRIAEIRMRAKARQRDAVGFFRSHLRPGEMRPSLADRSLLAAEFKNSLHALLLIEGREPRTATFFLGADGHLPGEPSVKNFRFDEREFKALPEVQPEPAALTASDVGLREKRRAPGPKTYGIVAALLAIAVVACIMMWFFSGQPPLPQLLASAGPKPNPVGLSVASRGNQLHITWDHAARELDRATGATLLIVDGPGRQELQLGVDELRLGAVEYEGNGAPVAVTMTLHISGNTPGSNAATLPPNQTVYWGQR